MLYNDAFLTYFLVIEHLDFVRVGTFNFLYRTMRLGREVLMKAISIVCLMIKITRLTN